MDSKIETKVFPIKRDRGQNWETMEREMLRQFVERHLEVVENKGNELKMIRKKKGAWESICSSMNAAGYRRSIDQMKQQWARMKMAAKKSAASVKRAVKATGNSVVIPAIDSSDALIQAMIVEDLEDDTILIDSNTILHIPSAFTSHCNESTADIPITTATQTVATRPTTAADTPINIANSARRFICTRCCSCQHHRTLSRTMYFPCKKEFTFHITPIAKKQTSKYDVMSARQAQIEEERAQAAELHLLELEQRKQLNSLRIKQLQEQIAQQRELYEVQLRQLNSL